MKDMICYHQKINKAKILIAVVLLLSGTVSLAADSHLLRELPQRKGPIEEVWLQGTVFCLSETGAPDKEKFAYAELLYQRNYGDDKFMVYGKTVSDVIKKSVSQTKFRDEALEIMGAEGWELVSTVMREFTGGFEIFYYLKKTVE